MKNDQDVEHAVECLAAAIERLAMRLENEVGTNTVVNIFSLTNSAIDSVRTNEES
jgi:hypothetical protein